jgi:hypothetical protein
MKTFVMPVKNKIAKICLISTVSLLILIPTGCSSQRSTGSSTLLGTGLGALAGVGCKNY